MAKKKKETEHDWERTTRSIVQGTIIAFIIALIFLMVSAILIEKSVISEKKIESIVFLICVLSMFLAGVIQKVRMGRWSVVDGVVSAVLACFLYAGMGFLIWKNISFEEGRNIVISCVCGGGLAGVLFGKRRKTRRGTFIQN